MKMTKKNIIRVLKARADNNYTLYLNYKDSNKEEDRAWAEKARRDGLMFELAIDLMTKKELFDEMVKIYFPDEE